MGIESTSQTLLQIIEKAPEVNEQFRKYAEAGNLTAKFLYSHDHESIIHVVMTMMVMGAALYRELLMSRGLDPQEVEQKILSNLR